MSRCMRYQNPAIYNHLASQYVAAVLTPKVHMRVETLRRQVPELNMAIASWSDHFAKLHDGLPEVEPAKDSWYKIERYIKAQNNQEASTKSWWNTLFVWQITGMSASLTAFVFALVLFLPATETTQPINEVPIVSSTPSYLAVMSPHAINGETEDAIHFVVNVYQKTATTPNRVFIQWSEQESRTITEKMHLWAKNRETGQLIYIGSEPDDQQPWELGKPTWQAVTASSHLLFTTDDQQPSLNNTLFSGPCIQLGSWKQNSI